MLRSYIRTAFRSLTRNKGYSLINVLGLAISITSCLILFVVLRFEMSFDDFHTNEKSIYRIVMDFKYPEGDIHTQGVQGPAPEAFRTDFTQLEKVATIFSVSNSQINVLKGEKQEYENRFKEEKGVLFAEPEFFEIFNFRWVQGREQSTLVDPNSVVLTQATAEKYFGTWQNAMGRFIQYQNYVLKVNGILENVPVNSDFPLSVVISFKTRKETDMSWGNVTSGRQCYFRLSENSDVAQIQNLFAAFEKKHYNTDEIAGRYALQPLSEIHFDARYGNLNGRTMSKSTLLALGIIGVFLLITAGINFINLAIAQVVKKSKEVGVRKVLGSARVQLMLQFFGETFFILLIAAGFAVLLSEIVLPFVRPVLDLPKTFNPVVSLETFVFLVTIISVLTLLSGMYPAFVMAGFKPIKALKSKIHSQDIGGVSLRKGLVVVQFAIAQILITVTMVIFLQLDFFHSSPLGFDKDGIIYFSLPSDSLSQEKFGSLRNTILQQPGVRNVSLSFSPPSWSSYRTGNFRFDKSPRDEPFEVHQKYADTSFFATYGIPILAGRIYQLSDTAREYVVNESFIRKLGLKRPEEVLAKTITMSGVSLPIVGVMKDFHLRSLHQAIEPLVISSNRNEFHMGNIKLQQQDLPKTIDKLGDIYTTFFPSLIFEYQFLDERLARSYKAEQRLGSLTNIFSSIAIFISCLGLYGMISFIALQRTKEVGIRKVLGATIPDILFLFSKEFIILVLVAFALAAPVAGYFMENWLNTFAYHIHLSIWIFIISISGTLLVALLTLSSQAIKAALANPVQSLRNE